MLCEGGSLRPEGRLDDALHNGRHLLAAKDATNLVEDNFVKAVQEFLLPPVLQLERVLGPLSKHLKDHRPGEERRVNQAGKPLLREAIRPLDRKSTRLNSSHLVIS